MAIYSLCWDVKWFSSAIAKQYKPHMGVIWVVSLLRVHGWHTPVSLPLCFGILPSTAF